MMSSSSGKGAIDARKARAVSISCQLFPQDHERNRHAQLGCTVLSQAPCRAQTLSERDLWTYSLPQLSLVVPTLGAAVAAFGASYESCVLDHDDSAIRLAALKQYARAVQMLKQETESHRFVPLPLLLACVVLACVEVMHHRPRDALTHLRGAFAMMSIHENWKSPPPDFRVSPDQDTHWILDGEDDLSLLLVKLDLQKATYGGAPDLSLTSAASIGHQVGEFRDVHEADRALCKILNSCYQFITSAGHYKYKPASTVPSSFQIEQGHHLANLRTWLSLLHRLVRQSVCNWKQMEATSNGSYIHALVLRSQCLGAIITASTVLNTNERGYDTYAPQFQQIVQAVEEVMRIEQTERVIGFKLPSFTPEMGIIQPLFLTAEKYRDSVWRRRAIQLLQQAGREGPWVGKIEAVVARSCADFEEKNAAGHGVSPHILPEHIDEKDRLCGSSIFHVEQAPDSMLWAHILLYKRRDVNVLSGNDIENESHWQTWQEIVGIPRQEIYMKGI
jgi:hypothetical protein